MKVLILWSGGLDSTSVLKYYLEQTDFEIVTLNVRYLMKNNRSRQDLENESIKKLLPELLKIRKFKHLQSTLELDIITMFMDVYTIGVHCFNISIAESCNEIVFGFVEDVRPGNIELHTETCRDLNKMIEIFFNMHKKRSPIFKVLPVFVMSKFVTNKKEYIKNLGNLMELTWSCRDPKDNQPCGNCTPCKHIKMSK